MRWTRILRVGGGPKTPTGIVQDGPPQGGFPAVKVGRSLPGGGMSSIAMAAGCVLTFSFGMYKIIMANRFRRCSACLTQLSYDRAASAICPWFLSGAAH